MRILFLAAAILVLASAASADPADLLPAAEPGIPGETVSVSVSSRQPAQGDTVLVEIFIVPPPDNLAVSWKGRTMPARDTGSGRRLALIGVDLQEPAGPAPLAVAASRDGSVSRTEITLRVREKEFPVQELSLPETMAVFDNETLARIRAEAERLREIFAAVTAPSWDFPFLPPVDEFFPRGFGSRRIINGEPRSPHAGVDVFLPEGSPVKAIASGTVAFAGVQFFGGNSVVLDHGGGVFSVYYHLREFVVSEGARVTKGERIGSVGATGRATGPHLHFGVRVPGGRVDPSGLYSPAFH